MEGALSYTADSYLEYYNSGLDLVLGLRLSNIGSNSNAVALKSRYFEEGSDSAEQIVRDVIVTLADSGTQTVLAPFNLYGKHWLRLLFRNLWGRVEVTHMDQSKKQCCLP